MRRIHFNGFRTTQRGTFGASTAAVRVLLNEASAAAEKLSEVNASTVRENPLLQAVFQNVSTHKGKSTFSPQAFAFEIYKLDGFYFSGQGTNEPLYKLMVEQAKQRGLLNGGSFVAP